MTAPPRHPRQGGFTLLEALIAATILALAIFGISVPFAAGAASEAEDARRTLATALAQEMMEEILSRPYDDPDKPGDGSSGSSSTSGNNGNGNGNDKKNDSGSSSAGGGNGVGGLGHEPNEKDRADYDSINDYALIDERTGQIADLAGDVVSDSAATGLSRHTRVEYVRVGGQTESDNEFVRVSVEIRYHGQTLLTLSRLVYRIPLVEE